MGCASARFIVSLKLSALETLVELVQCTSESTYLLLWAVPLLCAHHCRRKPDYSTRLHNIRTSNFIVCTHMFRWQQTPPRGPHHCTYSAQYRRWYMCQTHWKWKLPLHVREQKSHLTTESTCSYMFTFGACATDIDPNSWLNTTYGTASGMPFIACVTYCMPCTQDMSPFNTTLSVKGQSLPSDHSFSAGYSMRRRNH